MEELEIFPKSELEIPKRGKSQSSQPFSLFITQLLRASGCESYFFNSSFNSSLLALLTPSVSLTVSLPLKIINGPGLYAEVSFFPYNYHWFWDLKKFRLFNFMYEPLEISAFNYAERIEFPRPSWRLHSMTSFYVVISRRPHHSTRCH